MAMKLDAQVHLIRRIHRTNRSVIYYSKNEQTPLEIGFKHLFDVEPATPNTTLLPAIIY